MQQISTECPLYVRGTVPGTRNMRITHLKKKTKEPENLLVTEIVK